MSQIPLAIQQKPAGVWQMYRAMVGIGILCGLLIVVVFEWTRPVIERNRAEALQRAIFQVLPAAKSSKTFLFQADGGFRMLEGKDESTPRVYAGYDEQERLIGIAIEAAGMGYQDVIRVLYGYSFHEDAVVGIRVLESKETPGLGTKIETDPEFLANFKRLDVALTADGSAPAHPIEFVKKGQKEQPWQVDGITGATISSAAIARILGESTAYWIPKVRARLDELGGAE